jgi:hypothetical protein
MEDRMSSTRIEDEGKDVNPVTSTTMETRKGRPSGYHLVEHVCARCSHIFVRRMCDEDPWYYCTFLAGPRPPSGAIGETWIEDPTPYGTIRERILKEFEEWAEDREVQPHGSCPWFSGVAIPVPSGSSPPPEGT